MKNLQYRKFDSLDIKKKSNCKRKFDSYVYTPFFIILLLIFIIFLFLIYA